MRWGYHAVAPALLGVAAAAAVAVAVAARHVAQEARRHAAGAPVDEADAQLELVELLERVGGGALGEHEGLGGALAQVRVRVRVRG